MAGAEGTEQEQERCAMEGLGDDFFRRGDEDSAHRNEQWRGCSGQAFRAIIMWVHDVIRQIRISSHVKWGKHRGISTRPDGSHVGTTKRSFPSGKDYRWGIGILLCDQRSINAGTRVQESGRKRLQCKNGIGGDVGVGTEQKRVQSNRREVTKVVG